MRTIMTLAAALSIAIAGAALAQDADPMAGMDHGTMAKQSDAAAPAALPLPQACAEAAGAAATPETSGEAGGAMAMEGMGDLDAVQKANHDAMAVMHAPMMQAAMIKDADLAFNCGMIAHHQGAIAMAKVQIAMGKDAASKALAEEIIAAQEKEIAEMTTWIEANAK